MICYTFGDWLTFVIYEAHLTQKKKKEQTLQQKKTIKMEH